MEKSIKRVEGSKYPPLILSPSYHHQTFHMYAGEKIHYPRTLLLKTGISNKKVEWETKKRTVFRSAIPAPLGRRSQSLFFFLSLSLSLSFFTAAGTWVYGGEVANRMHLAHTEKDPITCTDRTKKKRGGAFHNPGAGEKK